MKNFTLGFLILLVGVLMPTKTLPNTAFMFSGGVVDLTVYDCSSNWTVTLEGVTVTMLYKSSGTIVAGPFSTDPDGKVTISDLAPGEYTIVISRMDATSKAYDITIDEPDPTMGYYYLIVAMCLTPTPM